jgi:winged helix DNA-binding protein
VHVPPRGIWGDRGPVVLTAAEAWLGRSIAREGGPNEFIVRYLGAFGPATVAYARTWSGLGGLGGGLRATPAALVTFRDERGRELFDVPRAPLPDPDAPAPPQFLSAFDNALLSHADRSRIIAEKHREALFKDPLMRGVLLDGFARATWKTERSRGPATLVIEPFEPLPRRAPICSPSWRWTSTTATFDWS